MKVPVPIETIQLDLTLRDWFAGMVVASILNHSQSHTGAYDYVATAIGAYQLADEMLKVREES